MGTIYWLIIIAVLILIIGFQYHEIRCYDKRLARAEAINFDIQHENYSLKARDAVRLMEGEVCQ